MLAAALVASDVTAAVEAAGAICATVGTPAGDADVRTAIEHLVRAIAANRQSLLPLRAVAPELARAVKNPWRVHGVQVDPAGVLAGLPESEVRSVRLDPELTLGVATDGVLGKPQPQDGVLRFRHSRKITATVEGPAERLELLARTLPTDGRLMADELRAARVPIDLDGFKTAVDRKQSEIQNLLDAGRALVETVERLVCKLYDVPDALTDRVVASAVSRTGSTGADGD